MLAGIDPALRLYDLRPLAELPAATARSLWFWFRLLLAVSAIALALALAGIYAVMAFTVTRRTREIGLRVALGAAPARVLAAVFLRPLRQVAAGLLAGVLLAALLTVSIIGAGNVGPLAIGVLFAYALLMLAVCLAACVVPSLRVLRVQPQVALRDDG